MLRPLGALKKTIFRDIDEESRTTNSLRPIIHFTNDNEEITRIQKMSLFFLKHRNATLAMAVVKKFSSSSLSSLPPGPPPPTPDRAERVVVRRRWVMAARPKTPWPPA